MKKEHTRYLGVVILVLSWSSTVVNGLIIAKREKSTSVGTCSRVFVATKMFRSVELEPKGIVQNRNKHIEKKRTFKPRPVLEGSGLAGGRVLIAVLTVR